MPSTAEITERVLSGEGVWQHTNSIYYVGEDRSLPNRAAYVPAVLKFLRRLKAEIDQYYRFHPVRRTNYEDLYYVASQIEDSESGEYDNPAVQPLIDKILPEIQPVLVGNEDEGGPEWELHKLAGESTNYIQDVVWHSVDEEPTRSDHLDWMKAACTDHRLSSVDVFTLNHDTVLEQCLSKNSVPFADGFGEPVNRVRYWNPDSFDELPRVRLFKLHGSVKWFQFRNGSVGIPLDGDIWHTKDPAGNMQLPLEGRPVILAGTFNKMLKYTNGIYSDLHCEFHRSLRHTWRLVICGYGFGDKGINTRIVEWVYSSPDRRLTIVHPEPEDLRRAARGAISMNWDRWETEHRMTIIPKAIEQASWQDIWDSLFGSEG